LHHFCGCFAESHHLLRDIQSVSIHNHNSRDGIQKDSEHLCDYKTWI
jgi:hypothetical protein